MQEIKRGKLKLMISELVMLELEKASKEIRTQPLTIPYLHVIQTKSPAKAFILADKYIAGGALSNKSYADAVHIATATLQGADIVASWNFKHMVNVDKIKLFNIINTNAGFRKIKIMTPHEILNP